MDYSICPRCGQKALSVATRCPRCGLPFETQFIGRAASGSKTRKIPPVLLVGGAMVLVLFASAIWLKPGVAPPGRPAVTAIAPAPIPGRVPAAAPPTESLPVPPAQALGRAADSIQGLPSHPIETPSKALPPVTDSAVPAAPVAVAAAVDSPATQRMYATTWINVRSDRSNAAPVLRILKPGELVRVDLPGRGWYRVASDSQPQGFVDRRYLSDSPPTTPP
jgi:hypothetical protein